VVFELYHGAPTVPGGGLKPNWVISRRDGTDHVENLRAELGLAGKAPAK
jgi:hypothetical protein